MRVLLPSAETPDPSGTDPGAFSSAVDPYDAYRPPRRRWLRVNMVVSLDGAVTDLEGRSGGLAGAGDRWLFSTLRALADAVVVGAGTARAEGYGPHRPTLELRRRRTADGRTPTAPIVVVTGSARLDYGSRLFVEAEEPTVVLTCRNAAQEHREAAAAAGRLVVAGESEVDLREALRVLRERLGLETLLCEGGPHLNGSLLAAGLVDELCTTISPRLVPGPSPRYIEGLVGARQLRLDGVLEHDGELFLRHHLV